MQAAHHSHAVRSSQAGIHRRLESLVERYESARWKNPLHGATCRAFEALSIELSGDARPLILDSGCGTGASTRRLAERFPPALVIGVDLLYQGEFLADGKPLQQTRRVDNTREAAAYTLGYNPSLFARRVHDVLTVVSFVADYEPSPTEIWLIGLDQAGPWAAAALAQAATEVDRAAIATGGFRFIDVQSVRDENLLPGGAKYHDLPGMLALAAPRRLWVADEDEVGLSIVLSAYRAASVLGNLTLAPESSNTAAIDWLLGK